MEYFNSEQAHTEGWGIFQWTGENGPFQLQKHDEAEKFEDDGDAVSFVVGKAMAGSEYHITALVYLRDNAPRELINFPAIKQTLENIKR